MSINKLNDNQLVMEYQKAKRGFVFAKEWSKEELKFEKLYDKLFKELNKRDIDIRKYIN